jgi:hypothetical protein
MAMHRESEVKRRESRDRRAPGDDRGGFSTRASDATLGKGVGGWFGGRGGQSKAAERKWNAQHNSGSKPSDKRSRQTER